MSDFECPKCGCKGMLMIDHGKGERVKMRIEPNATGLINAKTAGGVLENFGKLLESIAKDSGWRSEAIIRGLTTEESGAMEFTVEMVPVKPIQSKLPRRR